MKRALGVLLFLSCESHWQQFPADHCPENQCLQWLGVDRPESWECSDLKAFEVAIVPAYAKHLKGKWAKSETQVCDELKKYRTFIAHGAKFTLYSWQGMPKQEVYGATECYAAVMKVGNSKTNSAIFHEAGHAIAGCAAPADCESEADCYHAGWDVMGFAAAEAEARMNF